jgi:hypothetical protein
VSLAVCVLLPFAAGYYLCYLYALIATDLTAELGLSAADLGLLTSVYFLVFAAVVLPCGALLNRYGPHLIDSTLLLLDEDGIRQRWERVGSKLDERARRLWAQARCKLRAMERSRWSPGSPGWRARPSIAARTTSTKDRCRTVACGARAAAAGR